MVEHKLLNINYFLTLRWVKNAHLNILNTLIDNNIDNTLPRRHLHIPYLRTSVTDLLWNEYDRKDDT